MMEGRVLWHLEAVALELGLDQGTTQVAVVVAVEAVDYICPEMGFVDGEEGHPMEVPKSSCDPMG